MSLLQSPVLTKAPAKRDSEFGHRLRVRLAILASSLLVASIALYGANYYFLPMEERPFSPKYELLRPAGAIGIKLGILGTVLFFIIFLYAFRKKIAWLGRIGTARHWMDFHIVAGVTAPIVIAFHASFKFRGIAGVAFWFMLAVAISGIIGRYLYAKIPRSLTAAEISFGELQSSEYELSEALSAQSVYSPEQLQRVLYVPSAEHIKRIGPLLALGEMLMLDLRLPFQLAGLRRAGRAARRNPAGRVLRASEVEDVVRLVRQKASLSRRIIFLNHTQRVFHLWHVVHRPFSYAFAVLAVIHICVVMGLGYF